ncbi:MAG TPA: argininosuccinate lyase [Gammaproteobacteria bacterium]|jgi:argininosuccinate lyase|nr:argininosuccinate lyase [Gammaproteobacteria bacterium]
MTSKKPWGGRFHQDTNALVEAFTESISFDHRLSHYDIQGSIAHARMLEKVAVLTSEEANAIEKGLRKIDQEISNGDFEWSSQLEDVHMNIEAELTKRIGEAGKKLHTGRSRNDQVATDLRLYLRDVCDETDKLLTDLQTAIIKLAKQHAADVVPGYTHLQVAQPITIGHHLLAWVEMLQRDRERLSDARKRINIMPLGAAALAGTSFPIDREFCAQQLGFTRPTRNSIDSVSDRDFVIEYANACSLIAMHLSRFSEELVLWASESYKFIEIGDAFCTGSSIMPQKKNPDIAELVRGKSGSVIGHLVSLLVLMKGQPLAYNRDNQEDKIPVFSITDTVTQSLAVFAAMVPEIKFDVVRTREAAAKGYATATDLADYLVRKNVPFRDAHEVVGKAVSSAIEKSCDLTELSLTELQEFSAVIEQDVFAAMTLEGSVNARSHIGGTAPARVLEALTEAEKMIAEPA